MQGLFDNISINNYLHYSSYAILVNELSLLFEMYLFAQLLLNIINGHLFVIV